MNLFKRKISVTEKSCFPHNFVNNLVIGLFTLLFIFRIFFIILYKDVNGNNFLTVLKFRGKIFLPVFFYILT